MTSWEKTVQHERQASRHSAHMRAYPTAAVTIKPRTYLAPGAESAPERIKKVVPRAYLLGLMVLLAAACSPPQTGDGDPEGDSESLEGRLATIDGEWSTLEPTHPGMTVGAAVSEIVPRREDLVELGGAWAPQPRLAGSLNNPNLLPPDCVGGTERTLQDSVLEIESLEVSARNGSSTVGVVAIAARYSDPRIARFLAAREWSDSDDFCFGSSIVRGGALDFYEIEHDVDTSGRRRSLLALLEASAWNTEATIEVEGHCAVVADVFLCAAVLEARNSEGAEGVNFGEAESLLSEMIARAEQSLREHR